MTPQVAFNKVYEACVYGTRGKPYLSEIKNLHEILNREVDTGNRMIDDVMDMFNIWLAKRKAGQEYLHPTEKPVELFKYLIRTYSNKGDLSLITVLGLELLQ